jgi:AraC-like DNA-binding protein
MDGTRSTPMPRIARPAGVTGVEVHSGLAAAGERTWYFCCDYLIVRVSGSAPLVLDWGGGKTETVTEPSLVMLQPEAQLWVDSQQAYSYEALYISPEMIDLIFAAAPGGSSKRVVLPERVSDNGVLLATFMAVHSTLASAATTRQVQVELLRLMFGLLGANLLRRLSGREPHPAVINRAREHIRESYSQGLSLDELSRRVGMCKYSLVRAFKREFGLPPHAYQNYLRVMRAKRLISEGRPISGVAYAVGFTDQSHLNRHFKRFLGYTPGSYAKQIARSATDSSCDHRRGRQLSERSVAVPS